MINFKKLRDNEKKRQLIEKILASFVVSAAVIVSVVITNQSPVTADFLKVEAIGNEIFYRVDVQDSDERIVKETLEIEIKGNTEKYYVPLLMGENQGSQTVLGNSVNYTLNIMADLGYGREILDTENIQIKNSLAGAILDVRLDPETIYNQQQEALTYLINTRYFDPEEKVESAFLEYAYVYEEEYPQYSQLESSSPNELYYESILIENQTATTILANISNYNVTIHLRLVVLLFGEEMPTILDEYEFSTPFRFYGSIYIDDVGMDYVLLSVYTEYPNDVLADLFIDVYSQSNLLTSQPVVFVEGNDQNNSGQVRIDHLMPNAPHSVVLRAYYVNPNTGQEENVSQEPIEFTTSQMYQWEITSFIDNGSSFDIVVTTQNPFGIIQSVSLIINGYDENRNYLNYYSYNLLVEEIGPMEVYRLTVSKPAELYYDLELTLSKQINQSYYSEIIYALSV